MAIQARPWARFYQTPLWRARRDAQRRKQPLCERCMAAGVVRPMDVAHHVVAHRGEWKLFAEGVLESVCYFHHNSEAKREEHGRIQQLDADGWSRAS